MRIKWFSMVRVTGLLLILCYMLFRSASPHAVFYDFRSLVTPLFCRWFMKQFVKREFHSRSKFFVCLLTFCAGFIDAYTFIERGGTLVASQTRNVVFLSVELAPLR